MFVILNCLFFMEGKAPMLKHTLPSSLPRNLPPGSKFPEESREGHGVGGSPCKNHIPISLFYHIYIYNIIVKLSQLYITILEILYDIISILL